jgi:prepilin-type N-terminal cleavage/methylation domain-containing protein
MFPRMSRADAFSVSSVSRGFSFIELLLVIVILGLLAAVSIPWFGKLRRRAELRSAAMEIGTTLVAARMKAVKANVNTSVRINASSTVDGAHEIDTSEPTPPPVTPVPTPAPSSMVPLLLSARSIRFVETPGGGSITFDGSGRMVTPPAPTPGRIVIEGPVGIGPTNQILIETTVGGRVRIVTPVVWQ